MCVYRAVRAPEDYTNADSTESESWCNVVTAAAKLQTTSVRKLIPLLKSAQENEVIPAVVAVSVRDPAKESKKG